MSQKHQQFLQILIFFNPSIELQTTDNYLDWTSLSVLNLEGITWSSRQVPVGTSLTVDIATLTINSPIWLSAPIKVKQLGIINHTFEANGYDEYVKSDIYKNIVSEKTENKKERTPNSP